MEAAIICLVVGAVAAYGIWAVRDVRLRALTSSEEIEAFERKMHEALSDAKQDRAETERVCKAAVENLAKEMREAIGDLPRRVGQLESKGAVRGVGSPGWRG